MTTPLKARILIADDHPIVLRGLRMVLNAQPDLEVVAEASEGERRSSSRSRKTSTWRSWTSRCRA
jgi:DNA-binding NarL/FixJ family response regulator